MSRCGLLTSTGSLPSFFAGYFGEDRLDVVTHHGDEVYAEVAVEFHLYAGALSDRLARTKRPHRVFT